MKLFDGMHYLDTSALHKLVIWPDVKEVGSQELIDYKATASVFKAGDICIAEALGVAKARFFNKSRTSYGLAVNRLKSFILNRSIRVESIGWVGLFEKSLAIADEYQVDIVDAAQVAHLEQLNIKCMLITADKRLSIAAEKRDIIVWNLLKDSHPPALG